MIIDKTLPSPFIPQNNDNFDLRYCAKTEKIGEETKMKYEELMLDNKFKNVFKNFIFNYDYEQKLLLKNKEKNYVNNISKKIINNIYSRVNKFSIDLNSLSDFYNNKASYKQLPNTNNNKIIIDLTKDKYNTINDLNVNNNKKVDINNIDETIYRTIFKKESMKLSKIFEQKIKNNNNKKIKSFSNLSCNNNLNNMNISLNNKVYRRRINISGILSPARSDKYLLNNNIKRDNSYKIIHKNHKQKSIIFNSKYDLNLINKTPSNQNIVDKRQVFHNFNKYAALLSKSNSYRGKNASNPKNKSIKRIIFTKNRKSHNNNINYNIINNIIPSQPNKNIAEKKKYYKGLTQNKDVNNEIQNSLLYINGINTNKNKSRMSGKDNIILKSKISMTSNYNFNNNKQNNNNGSNKTFLNENKSRKNSSMRSHEEIIINEKNRNNSKKRLLINNSRININNSIKNLIRYNSKYISVKELNLNNQQNINKLNNGANTNKNLYNDKNSIGKENINYNLINNNKKRKIISINDEKKERIFVNKRTNNKTIANETEKIKYINNNSINCSKNVIKNKILKSKTNFSTLNNSSFKNSKIIKEKGNEKENCMSYRNIVMSYKQKQNFTGK